MKGGRDNYCEVINKWLPDDIRFLAYADLSGKPQFDARFSCVYREYNYFFLATHCGTDLDIDRLSQAAKKFVGQHDFKNFCKPDPAISLYDDIDTAPNSIRHIFSFEIHPVSPGIYRSIIKGSAFLWHQVRLMM
jgi:tRNA pseudouridine38/39 synthase